MPPEPFKDYIARLKRERAERVARVRAAFARSPAIMVESPGQFPTMYVLTRRTDRNGGWRITWFTTSGSAAGPGGHWNYESRAEAFAELASSNAGRDSIFRPVFEEEFLKIQQAFRTIAELEGLADLVGGR